MHSIRTIPVQKLFLITIFLKVLFSVIGWRVGSPWILGFAVPLTIMAAYIILGYYRVDSDVSDEKFADSCYYLGFIFTITSIILSLFDLPHIGTKLPEIAVRFGAAMVSTVLGLVVRVYLVSFKKDIADAVEAAEETVIDAATKFGDNLMGVIEKIKAYEIVVDEAARNTVNKVDAQMEALSKAYGVRLEDFFVTLEENIKDASDDIFAELKQTSARAAGSLDMHSRTMNGNLETIQAKVNEFSNAVTSRLANTTFPDDFFSKSLGGPMQSLRDNINAVSVGISNVATEVQESNEALSVVTKSLRAKAASADKSISTITEVAEAQERILAQAQAQIEVLSALSGNLKDFDLSLGKVTDALGQQSNRTDELSGHVTGMLGFTGTLNKLDGTLTNVVSQLESQRAATNDMNVRVESLLDKTLQLAQVVSATSSKVTDATNTIPAITDVVDDMRRELGSFGQHFATFGGNLNSLTEKLGNLEIKVQLPSHNQNVPASTDRESEDGKHVMSFGTSPLPASLT